MVRICILKAAKRRARISITASAAARGKSLSARETMPEEESAGRPGVRAPSRPIGRGPRGRGRPTRNPSPGGATPRGAWERGARSRLESCANTRAAARAPRPVIPLPPLMDLAAFASRPTAPEGRCIPPARCDFRDDFIRRSRLRARTRRSLLRSAGLQVPLDRVVQSVWLQCFV